MAPQNTDVGLFGPDSIVWRIHQNPAMLLGGLRALLLQALHPLAMAGVREHSNYRADPWARYRRTRDYIVTTSFGTTEDAERVAKKIVEIHNRIHGTDFVTGQDYDANDQDLLLWIHVCLVDSFLSSHEQYVEKLTDEQVSQYFTEMTRASELVLLDPKIVPTTRDEVASYFASQQTLCLTDAARMGAQVIISPPMFPLLKPFWWGIATGAVDLLPQRAIDLYGFSGLRRWGRMARPYNRFLQKVGRGVLGQAQEVHEAYIRAGQPNYLHETPVAKFLRPRLGPKLT